ncbi:MAG: hypothetical protein EAX86_06605 [Candidatus Heimdallarchaeota archaeon]|nr:hypothetical protein [Candidatus Heimdallarchaeota archaeon]
MKYFIEVSGYFKTDDISNAFKITINYLVITDILKFCKNIYDEYKDPIVLGRMLHLPFFGAVPDSELILSSFFIY